ncbi:MAG: ribonuclease III [Verrucomicrobia bacterium]|nr:ribonuclease III [Verrucomicrobiota bacterium]MCG2678554.1 ribonuclease III [Kiritimatiellia bacterium]MBU4247469.1 ribonuclease III [Verrucomicrobiota bacterium]MBU4292300.1 ribonuclease III [Verrucomicrobiota bacterium]MBU4430400.1 ribonuclease III [Verrucomicrobiota bacterium]
MRSFFHNPYRSLEHKLGYAFRSKALLETALMHRSYRFESTGIDADNQRLEFLGDAALGLVATDYLFKAHNNLQEGSLTCLRSRLTSGKALAKISRSIGLGEYLRLGKGERMSGGQHRASNITDAMEAILGAAYLDRGLKAVEKIFIKLFIPLIEIEPDDAWSDNPKGQLQVIAQRRWKSNPQYHVLRQDGPSHLKVFTIRVSVGGNNVGTGRGATKREAEQNAAQHVLEQMQENY